MRLRWDCCGGSNSAFLGRVLSADGQKKQQHHRQTLG